MNVNKEAVISNLKGAFKSWTVWFNAVGIPILLFLNQNVELWQVYAGVYTNDIIIVINILLRLKTTNALREK